MFSNYMCIYNGLKVKSCKNEWVIRKTKPCAQTFTAKSPQLEAVHTPVPRCLGQYSVVFAQWNVSQSSMKSDKLRTQSNGVTFIDVTLSERSQTSKRM